MERKLWKIRFVNYTKIYAIIYIISFFTVIYVIGALLKLIHTELWVEGMVKGSINYDTLRELKLSEENLVEANVRINHIIKKHPKLAGNFCMNEIGYLSFGMIARDYDLLNKKLPDEDTFLRGIGRVLTTKRFHELYDYYRAILSDLNYFPVLQTEEKKSYVFYDDSWNTIRTYGGNRRHEGTDIMASNNLRGYFPVVSITDGIVENIGWLEQGGYRIGVRSPAGGYFYYAHLYSYAPDIKKGDEVIAGQLLGFMGDSGYGKEGTTGKFDVHLHLGIYVNSSLGEMSVNPYLVLKILELHKLNYKNVKEAKLKTK